MDKYTWHDVIKECEQVLGCEYSADSPLMCNLPNLIRDLQFKLEKAERHLTSKPDITIADPKEVVKKAAQTTYERWRKGIND